MFCWDDNDAALDLYKYEGGWRGRVAMVRPHLCGFRLVIIGTDTQVPVFIKCETREEAMEAAMGFVKLLKEN
jgi:hypothetical protein